MKEKDKLDKIGDKAHYDFLSLSKTAIIEGVEMTVLPYDYLDVAVKKYAKEYADWKIKELTYFLEHSRECILSQFEEGEPTENGGYRQKYAGKWYQTRPINNIPKCTCGLDHILSNKDKK